MLKSLAISLSFLPLLAEASFAKPVSYPYPTVNKAETETLLCYIQTSDGRTISLDNLCKPMLPEDASNNAIATSDNSNESASKFAARQCYLVDAQGKPCPSSN